MITTVTLNPMLDKTVEVAPIRRGSTQRAVRISMIVGGKGVNVSRQLQHLGCPTLATGFIGGEIGDLLERLLNEESIPFDFVKVRGMTREGITYRESDGTITAIFEPPHRVTPAEAARLVERCAVLMDRSTWVVCSGSSPCVQSDRVFRQILTESSGRMLPSVLDSYGAALREGIAARPTIVKCNRVEFTQTFRRSLRSVSEISASLQSIVRSGTRLAILTDGPRAAYAAAREGVWKIVPPKVRTVNSTGSGDAMLAGLLFAFRQGWDLPRAMAFGAAAGAANAARWEVASSSLTAITRLARAVRVEKK